MYLLLSRCEQCFCKRLNCVGFSERIKIYGGQSKNIFLFSFETKTAERFCYLQQMLFKHGKNLFVVPKLAILYVIHF